MIRVQQKQTCGCTIAAVATIVGKTYDEVAAESTRDFDTDGVCIEDWYDYLFNQGFAFYRKYKVTHIQGPNKKRDVWPPEPFAPVHICSVATSASHAVVMLANGDVLDPNKEGIYKLTDYISTHFVIGLYRIKEYQ